MDAELAIDPEPDLPDSKSAVDLELVESTMGMNDFERQVRAGGIGAITHDPTLVRLHSGFFALIFQGPGFQALDQDLVFVGPDFQQSSNQPGTRLVGLSGGHKLQRSIEVRNPGNGRLAPCSKQSQQPPPVDPQDDSLIGISNILV